LSGGECREAAALRNIQLEIQHEQYENTLLSAKAALFMAETKLQDARLGVESRLLSLEKNHLNLAQQELILEDARITLAGKIELYNIGGITTADYRNLQLSVSSKETDISILKKEQEMANLGLRDEDLIEAGYGIAEDKEERKRDLVELNTRTQAAELQTARANVSNAEKSLDSIKKQLDELVIKSTVTGIIGALYFENGEHVPANEKIATVMDISSVYAVFSIQEQDIINFTTGTALEIEIPSLSKTTGAAIDEISPVADPQSGNFSVKAELRNSDTSIKPGMFVKCVIPRRQGEAYPAISETALVKSDGSEGVVYGVVNGFAVLKQIQIRAQKEGTVWIAGGLKEHDLVVDKPSPFLKEGEHVQYD
jgi:RND family efflux transporter MFP subunit